MNISELHQAFLKSTGISTDSRQIKKGNMFFALKGENFNGNSYAKKALENGAIFCVIDEVEFNIDERCILVEDALITLQNLSKFHRNSIDATIIALTGSNGKTTTKELIYNVLSRKYNTVATKGNLNNHIGVPLTLLSMNEDTEISIVEMGANHLGEIKLLSNIAEPDYGLITNFGKAHLEGFGSEENIVKGKSELFDYLSANDKTIIANTLDRKQMEVIKSYDDMKAISEANEDKIVLIESQPVLKIDFEGEIFETSLNGHYNFNNVRFAIAIGKHFNVSKDDIISGISNYIPTNNRSQLIKSDSNLVMLDAYNANPSSMVAALDNFEKMEGQQKLAILGDMFELGKTAHEEHQGILDYALNKNIEDIYVVGDNFYRTQSSSTNVKKFNRFEDLSKFLNTSEVKNRCILIKGSRGMALERLVDLI